MPPQPRFPPTVRRWPALLCALVPAFAVAAASAHADGTVPPETETYRPIERHAHAPRLEHPLVADPAALTDEAAERIYQAIRSELQAHYARSNDPISWAYTTWTRANTTPYRSRTHGQVFVNNYANDKAAAYGEAGTVMPEGALIAKDSFVVTANGDILTGALGLMEKMAPGYDPANGDWRYMTIEPDGRLTGLGGEPSAPDPGVAHCTACHNAAPAGQDHLFLVPPARRAAR